MKQEVTKELQDDYDYLVGIMSQVVQKTPQEVKTSRLYPLPICRGMVFKLLLKYGYMYREVSAVSGLVLSSITHAINQFKHAQANPTQKRVQDTYNEFNTKLKENGKF